MGRQPMMRLWVVVIAVAVAAISADEFTGDVVMLEMEHTNAKGGGAVVAKAQKTVDDSASKAEKGVTAAAAAKIKKIKDAKKKAKQDIAKKAKKVETKAKKAEDKAKGDAKKAVKKAIAKAKS